MRLMIILMIVLTLVLTGCQTGQASYEKTQVIECNNILFKCTDKDRGNQCGKLMSGNNRKVLSAQSINSGKGCECQYVDYG
jgi:hypothetical protein